jgi:hypothetical protein
MIGGMFGIISGLLMLLTVSEPTPAQMVILTKDENLKQDVKK